MNIDQKDIEQYLSEVKDAVEKDNYRLDRNARRQDNINLFLDYVIDEAKAKEIILSLTAMDFSEILQNEHKGFEHEQLYVFGKDVVLLERTGTEEKTVSLYIKFNKLENCFVVVISFHEQITRRQIGGDHYDREDKKRLLHRMQERDRVLFAEEGHHKEYKG